MVEVEAAECVAGKGIAGDRFFAYKPDYKGQVTFFAWETVLEMRRRFALPEDADAEQIAARSTHGVLEIGIAKLAKAQPRRITVEAA